MVTDVNLGGLPLSREAIRNSVVVERYNIGTPKTGVSGFLYRNSDHRQILIATTNYVDINKVN